MSNNAVAGNAGVRAEARRWFLTMQNNPSRRQRAACDKWRKSSPEHEESWQAIESVWQDTAAPGQLLAEKEAGILSGYLAVMDKNKARTTRRRVISASVFSLLLVIMIVTGVQNPSWLQNLSADQVAMKENAVRYFWPMAQKYYWMLIAHSVSILLTNLVVFICYAAVHGLTLRRQKRPLLLKPIWGMFVYWAHNLMYGYRNRAG